MASCRPYPVVVVQDRKLERHFQLFDCGVLQRFSRSSPQEIRQTMVVLYAPIFEGRNTYSDYTDDQTISFIDSNGVQRHFTTKKTRGTKKNKDGNYVYDDIRFALTDNSLHSSKDTLSKHEVNIDNNLAKSLLNEKRIGPTTLDEGKPNILTRLQRVEQKMEKKADRKVRRKSWNS